MKANFKTTIFFILFSFLGLTIFTTSCNEDEPINPDNPTENENATQFIENGTETTIIDRGEGVGTKTLTSDKAWVLEGFVFVNEGQVLTIEAGTVIKGKPGTGENASALIVARGGKIMAEGTVQKPIIFTAYADDLNGSVDNNAKGLWGGLIVLGKATTNNATSEKAIEGIPTSETRGLYGGTDDNDDSGVIRYVSIRHGGTDIGEGNEINGLTLGAVGKSTIIEFVEVVANKDDGIEFFGGCPQVKNALVAYCDDDCYDYDEGFHGKGQFWVAIQDEEGDRCGEHDGGPKDNQLGEPFSMPEIYNATYIGGKGESSKVITFRENAGGTYANSIFVTQTKGIDIEYRQDDNANMTGCCVKMWQDNKLNVDNNVFYDIAGITEIVDDYSASIFKISVPKDDNDNPLYEAPADIKSAWISAFEGNTNIIANPEISQENPIPANVQTSDLADYPADSFFQTVNYKGAFDTENWAAGWSLTFEN